MRWVVGAKWTTAGRCAGRLAMAALVAWAPLGMTGSVQAVLGVKGTFVDPYAIPLEREVIIGFMTGVPIRLTANGYDTVLSVPDPDAGRCLSVPENSLGAVAYSHPVCVNTAIRSAVGTETVTGSKVDGAAPAQGASQMNVEIAY